MPWRVTSPMYGWKSTTTLTRHYMQADEETLYAVVAEERKVRARKATEG
jgi:hypothetical protein